MGIFTRRPQGRRGLIARELKYYSDTHAVQYEVEEVERQGRMSRVRIVRLSGTLHRAEARSLLTDWQLTDGIAWFPEDGA